MANEIITPDMHARVMDENKFSGTWKLSADAVVIGSGAGGAVAAAELAGAGKKVVLIEEGAYFPPGKFTGDEYLSQVRLYRDAGFILTENQTASILQGRTLGGSTTINWQTSLYPPQFVTDEWERRFGLKGYGLKGMQPYIQAVHERLGVHDVPNNLINNNNAVLMRGGKKLGLNPEVLKNNSRKCIGLGRCGMGCPINAKQTMYLTYIPDALKHGAIVVPNMRAEKIKDGKVKTVYAEFTADPFEKPPKRFIHKMEIKAPLVIVSAGAIEGPALLQRSGLGNAMVGANLKIHPVSTIFARFNSNIDMYSGPPQSVVIKDGHNQNETGYGFWLEVSPYRPTLASAALPLFGAKHMEQIKDYKKLSAGIALVRDGADGATTGKVEWTGGRRRVHYELTAGDGQNLLRGLKMLAEVQQAAGATELIMPFGRMNKPLSLKTKQNFDWVLKEKFDAGRIFMGSAHPHGSIQAASDSKKGAINPEFELYGHKNIFVIDASFYPTGLSVNPQIATMSSAMRATRGLVARK